MNAAKGEAKVDAMAAVVGDVHEMAEPCPMMKEMPTSPPKP